MYIQNYSWYGFDVGRWVLLETRRPGTRREDPGSAKAPMIDRLISLFLLMDPGGIPPEVFVTGALMVGGDVCGTGAVPVHVSGRRQQRWMGPPSSSKGPEIPVPLLGQKLAQGLCANSPTTWKSSPCSMASHLHTRRQCVQLAPSRLFFFFFFGSVSFIMSDLMLLASAVGMSSA
ncbi:uncharacterized protein B0H64DRAFT_185431 [Chaetomium fimeti]|uniref:Uncharacterized protein n=1 Tax=Chaetomium fimeti TaxID=1854472 RepID=A0AAE0LRM4_9PEZI|nr:hypothetical protein B0H64DRAFT_185431 [Chaetomium fimeti]